MTIVKSDKKEIPVQVHTSRFFIRVYHINSGLLIEGDWGEVVISLFGVQGESRFPICSIAETVLLNLVSLISPKKSEKSPKTYAQLPLFPEA